MVCCVLRCGTWQRPGFAVYHMSGTRQRARFPSLAHDKQLYFFFKKYSYLENLKNNQIVMWYYSYALSPIKNWLKSKYEWIVILIQYLKDSSSTPRLYYLDSPICEQHMRKLSVRKNICENLCETFSTFYHSLYVWFNDVRTILIIFRLCLIFVKFDFNSTPRSWSYFMYILHNISCYFMYTDSHGTL